MRATAGLSVRRALALLGFLVLGASLAAPLRPGDIRKNGRQLLRALRGETIPQRDRTGFWFDPRYADFLAEVKRRTPESATVAFVVPRRPDVYLYQACYQLAPRRVVEGQWKDEAAWVATYPATVAEGPSSILISGGSLRAR